MQGMRGEVTYCVVGGGICAAAAAMSASGAPTRLFAAPWTLLTKLPQTPTIFIVALTQGSEAIDICSGDAWSESTASGRLEITILH